MEDLYQILKCEKDATHIELKRAYQKLVLQVHPDKQPTCHRQAESASDMFVQVDRAWKILGCPELRRQYDCKWRDRCLAQEGPIQDEVDIEEFGHLENGGGDGSDRSEGSRFCYECRCGGLYMLTDSDIQMKYDIVPCDSCSLYIKVLYSRTDPPSVS